jgi:HAD superfamily hydrolase (TIGR01509 family)
MTFFVGRGDEQTRLRRFIQSDSKTNVMFITGVSGVGKTRLVDHMRHHEFRSYEYKQVRLSIGDKQWIFFVTGLLRDLRKARGLGREPLKALEEELEKLITEHAQADQYLLIVDDVATVGDKLINFVGRFERASASRLILITQYELDESKLPANAELLRVDRLDENSARTLLAGNFEDLVESLDAWSLIERLEGNPHKLMMLRGFRPQPSSLEELEKRIESLTDPDINELKEVADQYVHFAALGCLRQPAFEEDMFAFLWDRLGHGGTEPYVKIRHELIDRSLIIRPDPGEDRLRINGGAHQQLRALTQEETFSTQAGFFNYFLAVYYRNRFSKAKGEPSMQDLESYVNHASRAGNCISAFRYIFEGGVLEVAFRKDLSLQLWPVLSQLERGLQDILDTQQTVTPSIDATPAQRDSTMLKLAKVKMELGRICKDLNDPENGLRYLKEARSLISEIKGPERDRLSARINHFRGICHSVLGQEKHCRDSYMESFCAAKHIEAEPLDALTLGYLAYETKFTDLAEAEKLAKNAVILSEHLQDDEIKMKNLCSLGQILSFARKFDESEEAFALAEKIGAQNVRELCRIKVNSMVTFIGKGDHERAEKLLEEAEKEFGETGDRRRLAMGKAYVGIIEFKRGNEERGRELVLEALKTHYSGGARRESLYEALTWKNWMADDKIKEPACITAVLEDSKKHGMELYETFWDQCYKPALLDSHSYKPWGVIFDIDGVIADTRSKHQEAVKELCRRHEITFDETTFREELFGRPNRDWIPVLFNVDPRSEQSERIAEEKEKLFRSACKGSVEALAGLPALLENLRDAGVPMAVASSAPRANIDTLLSETKLEDFFPTVLHENSIQYGKPEPDVFVKAAQDLELSPKRCIVFEDSLPGLEAGRRAGCKVIGVATTHEKNEIEGSADYIIRNFEELTLGELVGLMD